MMKKALAALLVLGMILSLCACGAKKDLSGSRYLGTWKAVSLSLAGGSAPYEGVFTVTLEPDGTATLSSEDEVTVCRWSETDSGFKVTGDAKMTFHAEGEGLRATAMGVSIWFERQG